MNPDRAQALLPGFRFQEASDAPGLAVVHSNRLEVLARALANEPLAPADPMVPEAVVVQSRGMQRYLSMVLARERGVCANVAFPFPVALAYELFCHALDDVPERPPLDKDSLAWSVWQVLPEVLERKHEPGFAPLGRYLERSGPGREFRLAERLASLLDEYTLFRPDMIRRWDQGEITGQGDTIRAFGQHEPWQAWLWRRVSGQAADLGRAQLLTRYLNHLQDGGEPGPYAGLSVFGVSSLPPAYLDLLGALSRRIPVRIYFLNPCRAYWGDIVTERKAARLARKGLDMSHAEEGHALLASMGQVGREFFDALCSGGAGHVQDQELFQDPGRSTLLQSLQQDLLDLEQPGKAGDRLVVRQGDDSLRVHCCHGPMREMEVLRDQILAMLDAEPDLTPRDFLVMVPDIEAYVPYIRAVFSDPSQPVQVPFSLDDRSASTGNDARALMEMLALAAGRFEAPRVMGILECPSIAATFGLASSDLAVIRQWLRDTGVRWGLDSDHRQELGFPRFEEYSWRSGLERLVLGVAMAPERDRLYAGLLPAMGVEGRADVLGRFLRFTDLLAERLRDLARPRPPREWASLLQSLLREFFGEQGGHARDLSLLDRVVQHLGEEAERAGCTRDADLEDVRRALESKLNDQARSTGFLARGVTFCSLQPMRAIPFEVIWLAGMDDASFPRRGPRPGFDLMAAKPRPLDRSMRADDRYLFLEALVSARRRLHVSYVGKSARDNSETPPSVLVSELLDAVQDNYQAEQGDLLDLLRVDHKLQAFHEDYFRPGTGLFSYSAQDCEGARRLMGIGPGEAAEPEDKEQRSEVPADEPLPGETLSLDELCRFLKNPCRAFSRETLGFALGRDEEPLGDVEPLDSLDTLERYQLRRRLLESLDSGQDLDWACKAAQAANLLPPGLVGERVFDAEALDAREQFERVQQARAGSESLGPLTANIPLGAVSLSARLDQVHGAAQVVATPSKRHGAVLVEAWAGHLALNAAAEMGASARAARGDAVPLPRETVLVCGDMNARFKPVAGAAALLADLAELRELGMDKPLPFFPKSAWEFADRLDQGREEALDAASKKWRSGFTRGEESDDYFGMYFGEAPEPLGPEFQELANRVFGPLRDALVVTKKSGKKGGDKTGSKRGKGGGQ